LPVDLEIFFLYIRRKGKEYNERRKKRLKSKLEKERRKKEVKA
jgi:hypothetical protein